jgi:hypothetical protein
MRPSWGDKSRMAIIQERQTELFGKFEERNKVKRYKTRVVPDEMEELTRDDTRPRDKSSAVPWQYGNKE